MELVRDGFAIEGELFGVFAFALERGVVAHDGAHVGFDIACGDEGLGADDLSGCVVDGIEEYG